MLPHILIVDSDGAQLALLLEVLESGGYTVTASRNFEDAVVRLKSGEFHAVVTAHHLAAHNGLHLILRGRAERPTILGVVTCQIADPVLNAEANALGAICVVAPWGDATELMRLLQPGIQPA
jgi:CheY-like chemotaxis protein